MKILNSFSRLISSWFKQAKIYIKPSKGLMTPEKRPLIDFSEMRKK
jgi:hypothetical protein